MTEHFLYNTQVGTGVKHVGGKGVAKGMGRYFMTCRERHQRMFFDNTLYASRG